MSDTTTIAGIHVFSGSLSSLLSRVDTILTHDRQLISILTGNPEILVQASKDRKLKEILNNADFVIPDGIGIKIASILKNQPIRERITGIQLTQHLLSLAEKNGYVVGVVGGTSASSLRTKQYLKSRYPSLSFWIEPGPLFSDQYDRFKAEFDNWLTTPSGKTSIHALDKTSILFVSLGAPKQEYFIHILERFLTENRKPSLCHQLAAVAVGGTFDELAGIVPRTPEWVDKSGFKWLFRLITQPWRIKRQLRLIRFIKLALPSFNS